MYQFINLREYKDKSLFDTKVIKTLSKLNQLKVFIHELKTKSVIIDTNHDLDKWWA